MYKSIGYLVLLLSISISNGFAADRFALVIGNADYPFEQLRNPSNDAKDIALVLEKYGFETNLQTNATLSQLKQSLNGLQSKLQSSKGIGVIYFAGHGVQLQTENFLLPIDVETTSVAELKRTALSLNDIVNTLDQAQNKLNLVILDACRNNPFKSGLLPGVSRGLQVEAGKDGLAPLAISASSGTVFWYATRPGDVALDGSGRNSPFTSSLLTALNIHAIPARSIISKVALQMRDLKINQQPWQEGIWLDDFHFDEASEPKKTPTQITHQTLKSKELNILLRDYIDNCKKTGEQCEDLETAEKLIKQPSIEAAEKLIQQSKEVSGYDAWLGEWQCTWVHTRIKGTNILEFYKIEKNILYGTSDDSECTQINKFKIDVSKSPLRYTLHQSATFAYTSCVTKRVTIDQISSSLEQPSFTSTYYGTQPNGTEQNGEETCIKIN